MRKVADVEPVRVWARRADLASTSPRKNAISVHPYAG